jgi:hypothetical protein
MQNPLTAPQAGRTPVSDLRALLPTIKSTHNYPLTPLVLWCKKCEEFHPSYKAFSTEQTALNKSFRLSYPTRQAADVTTREHLASQTRHKVPTGFRDALDSFCPSIFNIGGRNRVTPAEFQKDIPESTFATVDSTASLAARRERNRCNCTCTGCATDRKYHVGPIPRPATAERTERRVPFGYFTDKRFKVDIPVVDLQIPELPAVHESFGEGFPYETGRQPGTIWVSFSDQDRLVLTTGFLESSQPIVALFANQIVVKPRSYSQFIRDGRRIKVSKVGTDTRIIQSIREIATDRSEIASRRLVELLKQYKHLRPFAILPWTLNPIVGPIPETEHCPSGKAANSVLWKYHKGRTGSLNTPKDMSENTYRFTDVEARRNATLSGDPAFSNREFENMSLEFCDGAAGMDDPDSFLDPWQNEVQAIQSNWFSTTATVGHAVEAARKQLRKLEYQQTMMKFRRELTVAHASIEQGHWQLRYKECRQECLCRFPKCECMRPRFDGDSECVCSGIRCQCWRVVQKCKHQFASYRPFAFCPVEWIEDTNGDEYAARTDAEIARATGYSPKQIRKTLRDIDGLVRANDCAWRKKEHGRELPENLSAYYDALFSRLASYYTYTPDSLQQWAARISQLPAGLTPEQRATEHFQEWRLIHPSLISGLEQVHYLQ